jgi:hypothetical protein
VLNAARYFKGQQTKQEDNKERSHAFKWSLSEDDSRKDYKRGTLEMERLRTCPLLSSHFLNLESSKRIATTAITRTMNSSPTAPRTPSRLHHLRNNDQGRMCAQEQPSQEAFLSIVQDERHGIRRVSGGYHAGMTSVSTEYHTSIF